MNRLLFAALAAVSLSGCAVKLAQPSAAMDNVTALRSAEIPALNAGTFSLAPGAKESINKRVSVRGTGLTPEGDGTYSGHLKSTLISDLKAAGKYDTASPLVVEGQIIDNRLNAAGVKKADAFLAARIKVLRNGQPVYDRRIEQAAEWDSSFVGMVAIPEAINRFSDQFRLLLLKVYKDPDFLRAVKTP